MKKHYFLPMAAAMLLFAGCSDRNDEPGGNKFGDSSTDTQSYLAVNIVPTFPGSRAVEDESNYEQGEEKENDIKSVRFYFFTSDGSKANVKRTSDGDMVNYLDLTAIPGANETQPDGEGKPNVEKGLKATLVINTAQGDERPAKILAVINRSSRLGSSSADLATVRETSYDYADFAETENQFVMSSAVYASSKGEEISAVTIPEECFQDQESGAMLNPVVLYVERVVAKVRMKLDAAALGTTTIKEGDKDYVLVPLKDKNGQDIKINNTQVYAKFLGWNVTAATKLSSLSKHINPSWTIFDDWNYPAFFRSFWALNCAGAGTRYMPFTEKQPDGTEKTYSVIDGQQVKTSYTSLYTNENAAAHANATNGYGRSYPSTVIMAAQLCDANGVAISAYRWLSQTQVGEENLKTSMLEQLNKTRNMIYSKATVGSETQITTLTAADLKMATAVAAGKATLDETTTGRYNTYVLLSETGAAKKWYSTSTCEEGSEMSTAAVNAFLNSTLGAAEIWENGYTYYYFPIQHLGTMGEDGINRGAYGVVRNHIYEANVSSIIGLGTPVYDPSETIYPEKPENSDTHVAARINVQTWRLVHNDVTLDWGNN